MAAETENETKVIDFLSAKGYSFRQKLGEGTYASVLGFETPDNLQVAVKIIQQKYSWYIEDTIWPLLKHQNILPVIEIFSLDKSKLYVMPKMPGILDETVFGLAFKYDDSALLRIKKWTYEVLSALHYLHVNGLCHLDIKSDNVLISESDSAILSDFSGLNLTGCPIERCLFVAYYTRQYDWTKKRLREL